jgi:ketosteroid isomerase-like protein
MFEAFNSHDLDRLMSYFSVDMEMFHDTGGLVSYERAVADFGSNFQKNNGLRRELVPGSLQVYPIPGYGAMEIGSHTFTNMEDQSEVSATFQFVQVWKKTGDAWKLSRIVSYGH